MSASNDKPAERYASLVREWCSLPTEEFRKADAVFARVHEEYKKLRLTAEGRAQVEALMRDATLWVRVAASIDAL